LADAGDLSLATVAKPLAVEDLVGLGLGLARAVAGMHRRGVMHHDLCPANIMVGGEGAPCLVGFGLATGMAETRPDFTPAGEIVGTLAYLAPEQTGRTGRAVDERADLYAVGVTLYELATGAPPFGAGDPLRLLHDHLTRLPATPRQLNPAVPGPLSNIILHLLEKEPDRRHQTADSPGVRPGGAARRRGGSRRSRLSGRRAGCAVAAGAALAVGGPRRAGRDAGGGV
jgi:serine/threonine protein kinase